MQKFERLDGVAAPFAMVNVDTDKIIPARFMTALTRSGLGRHLFEEMRYENAGVERAGFVLNQDAYREAQILIADRNFGCGSSREHAVWSLADFGIRCVIAPSFGDIFASNARKNGLLLVRLHDRQCEDLRNYIRDASDKRLVVDLDALTIAAREGPAIEFEIDPDERRALQEGLDDIARTLRYDQAIAQHECAS